MSNDTMEGGQVVTPVEQPSSESGQPGVQQPSAGGGDVAAFQAKIDALEAQVKALQSGKDRGQRKLAKEVESIRGELEKYDAYLKKYSNPEDASRQFMLDRIIEREFGGAGTETTEDEGRAAKNPQSMPTVQIDAEFLGLLGISPDDPALTLALQQGKDPVEAVKTVAKAKQANPPAPTSPSENVPTGGAGSSQTNQAALMSEYQAKASKLRRGDWAAAAALAEEYRKKGLDVW
jgi:hypothetical protein